MNEVGKIDPREQLLPRWAQEALTRLRRRVEDAERRAHEARLATRPDETNTLIHLYDAVPIGLPEGETVYFRTGAPEADEYVAVYVSGNVVEISGFKPISVEPGSSNSITVRLRR